MSNRQFKVQASSSRAVSGGGGFGGFGSASTSSLLSYLTPPPNLSTISDSNVVVAFKGLSKKDATTKTKALEDLRAFVQSPSWEQVGGVETAILDAWLQFYPRMSIDNSRRVRELAHQLQHDLLRSTKQRMQKHLSEFAGIWLAGMYDRDRAVSKAARDSVTSFLDTDNKLLKFWKRMQPDILRYARDALLETPQTLCDERSMNADDIQETYFRVVGSSISLVINLLSKLEKADLLKQQDAYGLFFEDNPAKLWAFIYCDDAFLRRLVAQLLVVTLKKRSGVVEANIELLSKTFISEALRRSQTMSAYQLLQALEALTEAYPQVWTSSYKANKPALSKLQGFISKGSQGGPVTYWQNLESLLRRLPSGVLPEEIETLLDFFKALREGINSREEPRINAPLAWSCYFDIANLLVTYLLDEQSQGKLFQEAVFPVFEQYLHPSLENSKWSLGESTTSIAEAFSICAAKKDSVLVASLDTEWQRLADDFISKLRTSLPEQSKDYELSQASVLAEGHRWFSFINEVFLLGRGSARTKQILEKHSSRIIATALSTITSRNGKAYSAAATIEAALRTTPFLFEIPGNIDALKSFLNQHLGSLIISPSMKYLVSILHGLLSFPDQRPYFAQYWRSTIFSLLNLPKEDEADQLRALAALIASKDIQEIAKENAALQSFLFSACIKSLHGDQQVRPILEAAITFHTLDTTFAEEVVKQLIPELDISNTHLEDAFNVLELFGKKHNELLQGHNIQVMLLTKLLALSQLRNNALVSSRAIALRGLVEQSDISSERTDGSPSAVVGFIHEQLETASPQSLPIAALCDEARNAMKSARTPKLKASLFPNPGAWGDALVPFLEMGPNPALGVLKPFAGAVYLVDCPRNKTPSNFQRDISGYSIPLRAAFYTTHLLHLEDFTQFTPKDLQVQYLYLLGLTYEMVNDQIDLVENNMLFESHMDPDSMNDIRLMLADIWVSFSAILSNTRLWRDTRGSENSPVRDTSGMVLDLVGRFLKVAESSTPLGYYAGKALCRFLKILWAQQDWSTGGANEWLEQLGILNSKIENIFGASAILTGLRDGLFTCQVIKTLCNHLISDIASAPAQTVTLRKLILLNSCLEVYAEDDAKTPVAQNRLVFAVKQILSWSESLKGHFDLASEACRALQQLLPAIRDVYGTYWEGALNLCIAIWNSAGDGYLSDERLPAIGMSLKLVSILQEMCNANEDLRDALVNSKFEISHGLVNLLKLQRLKENLPLQYVDDLLLGQRYVIDIDEGNIKDLSEFYPLLASDFRKVQSAAFDILQKALVKAQQEVSINVALEDSNATLSEELLSLLLDAPTIDDYSDTDLEQFPLTVRRYLLSWHLIFDSFSSASNKVRADYRTIIEKGNYMEPFLSFMFDMLGHSAASAIRLDMEGYDDAMIREYNMWNGLSSISSERDMQWLLTSLYYLSLKYVPGLVKDWWLRCKNRQTSIAVEAWTEKYYSALIVQDLLDDVVSWSEKQTAESEEDKTLVVRVSRNTREVFAGYEIDELMMQIVIRLPANYPLRIATVESVNRVAISEKKWTSFIMITQGVIAFTNGSIVDGLDTFRKNVMGALKGHVECAICYSIVSSEKKLPDKQCATCRNLFHNECLHKWFKSSNANLCPLCRNPFNYGTNIAKRPREHAGPA